MNHTFSVLPFDLIEKIIFFLDYKSLSNLTLTNKVFNQFQFLSDLIYIWIKLNYLPYLTLCERYKPVKFSVEPFKVFQLVYQHVELRELLICQKDMFIFKGKSDEFMSHRFMRLAGRQHDLKLLETMVFSEPNKIKINSSFVRGLVEKTDLLEDSIEPLNPFDFTSKTTTETYIGAYNISRGIWKADKMKNKIDGEPSISSAGFLCKQNPCSCSPEYKQYIKEMITMGETRKWNDYDTRLETLAEEIAYCSGIKIESSIYPTVPNHMFDEHVDLYKPILYGLVRKGSDFEEIIKHFNFSKQVSLWTENLKYLFTSYDKYEYYHSFDVLYQRLLKEKRELCELQRLAVKLF